VNCNELRRVLQNTYKSIDIRSFLIRNDQYTSWDCIFLKISFSKDSIDELKRKQKQIDERLERGKVNFKIVLEAKDINYYPTINENLKRNVLRVNGIKVILKSLELEPGSMEVNTYQMYDTEQEYRSWFVYLGTQASQSVQNIIEKNGSVRKELSMDYYDIWPWFKINPYEWTNLRAKLIICFPIYIRRINVINQNSNEHTISYYIHRHLVTLVKTAKLVIRYRNNTTIDSGETILIDSSTNDISDMRIMKIIINEKEIIQELEVSFFIGQFDIPLYVDNLVSSDLYETASR
jgi:hypothetical protein